MTRHRHTARGARRSLAVAFAAFITACPLASAAAAPGPTTPTPPVTSPATPATPAPATTPAPAAAARRPASPPAVSISDITPTIAIPDADISVSVTLHNTTTRAVRPRVDVRAGERLRTRADVAQHAAKPDPNLPVVASAAVGQDMAPGSEVTVSVTIPAESLALARPYGVLPLTATVSGLPGAGAVPTFLPYQVRKEYEPLQMGVALPITADPDPALLTGSPTERAQARQRMTASGSRIDRILRVAGQTGAGLVVDPALLMADPTNPDSPDTPDTPAPAPAAPKADTDPAAVLTSRLADLRHDIWFLPPGDPDVSALTAASSSGSIRPLPSAPTHLPGTNTHTPTISWPAGTSSARVRKAVIDASSPVPDALLLPESRTDNDTDRTGDAARRDDAGHHVVVNDDRLSDLLTTSTTPEETTTLTQRALAESITLLAESPGLRRTVFLLPPRGLDPDPGALSSALQKLRSAPWITPVTSAQVLSTPPTNQPIVDPHTSPSGPASPLTAANTPGITRLSDAIAGLRPTIGDGHLLPADAEQTLTSTRWRGRQRAWTAASDTLHTRVETYTDGVRVVPSAINFFAEHGALQVTVVNDLDVDVRDVRLTAAVQGPSRLVVTSQPAPLTIRAHSRTTVRFDVQAVAAGIVPVTATLRTAGGTPLGEDATVRVRVQPTNGWIVLAAGGVVGLVFLFGLFRAIRAGERRVDAADLDGLDLR